MHPHSATKDHSAHTPSLQAHFESKHPTLPWEPEKCTNLHSLHGGTTQVGAMPRLRCSFSCRASIAQLRGM